MSNEVSVRMPEGVQQSAFPTSERYRRMEEEREELIPLYPMPWQAGSTFVKQICEITTWGKNVKNEQHSNFPYVFLNQLV